MEFDRDSTTLVGSPLLSCYGQAGGFAGLRSVWSWSGQRSRGNTDAFDMIAFSQKGLELVVHNRRSNQFSLEPDKRPPRYLGIMALTSAWSRSNDETYD